MHGMTYSGFLQAVLALVILDIIFLAFGMLIFRATEKNVRKRGALAQF